MAKNFLIFFCTIFLCSCASNYTSLNEDKLINNKKINRTFDSCSLNSYTSKNNSNIFGETFTEYIRLNSNCSWNGLSRSFFEELFKQELKIKTLKVVERLDYKNYEFTTYLVNNKYYVNLIWTFEAKKDKLIIDYKGLLTTKLIHNFNPNYINKYINKIRFTSNYKESLVNMNFVNHYFSKNSGGGILVP